MMETAEQDWDTPSPLPTLLLVSREISVRLRKAAHFLLSHKVHTQGKGGGRAQLPWAGPVTPGLWNLLFL